MSEKIKILYIDDEQNNLVGFKASFRFDFTIYTAATTRLAIEILKEHPDLRIILCDQRMPNQTGVEFFEEIRGQFPDPVRMLITGYTDIESVIDSINRGNIYRYIKKPWTDADIKSAIEEGNKFYLTNSMLKVKNAELRLAYDELGKFAYSVTHDIRGPLLSVLGALEIAHNTDDNDEIKEILQMMGVALTKLDEYIRGLHEYYSLKRGQLVYEQVNFTELVEDILGFFKITGVKGHIETSHVIEENGAFFSDIISIKIILTNLLSNAFKYQRKDATDKHVDIKIKAEPRQAVIEVTDNGIGIHQDHIGNIFTMFYRATNQNTGSGFGLYNVKDALSKLNGTVEVTSELDKGTTFKITIPGKAHATN
ncbi:MAG: hybrid sensor histidine kinase/response regulator [Chitinophagia bacterium]|nr:hybrid sensor histidine kinase/response regulator [Chitinophagia bacterium]